MADVRTDEEARLPREPWEDGAPEGAVDTVVVPRTRDLGGFEVRRALPSARRRMVGPFVFFDQMGPAVFRSGAGLDVRPHPHVGLATVTYLVEGEILHRDSLGTVQPIRPGAVNWMTAGAGIVHSERTPPEARAAGGRLFGVQLWVALPRALEESAPSFEHVAADRLPLLDAEGIRARVVLGELEGARSPARTSSEMLYADVALDEGARLEVAARHEERAVYVLEGAVEESGVAFGAGRLLVLRPGRAPVLRAASAARVLLLAGEPLDGPRHVFWNFVSSSRERIAQAAQDWRAGRFADVPGEAERIPLPETPRIARYP